MKEILESLQLIDSKINDCQYELTKSEIDKDKIYELLRQASKEIKTLLNEIN